MLVERRGSLGPLSKRTGEHNHLDHNAQEEWPKGAARQTSTIRPVLSAHIHAWLRLMLCLILSSPRALSWGGLLRPLRGGRIDPIGPPVQDGTTPRPEGARTNQPRATPWVNYARMSRTTFP